MTDGWDNGHREGQAHSHSNKRVRVGDDSLHVIASSKYIPGAISPYLSRRSSRLSSDSLRKGNGGHPVMRSFMALLPVDAASAETSAIHGIGHKHSLEFILNSDAPVTREKSLSFENEINLDGGTRSSTGSHVPTERKRKGTTSSSGVFKHSQKIPSYNKSIAVSSTVPVAKKLVKKRVRTRNTESDSSARTTETRNKEFSLKPEVDPVMVYFKLKANGGWYVRTKDNLMDPPPESSGSNDSEMNPSIDGSEKKTGPMTDSMEGSASSSSGSLQATSSEESDGEKIVNEQSATASTSSSSAMPSYRTKTQHNNKHASKVGGPLGASTSTSSGFTSIFESGKKQKASSDADKLKIYITTASAFAASTSVSASSSPNVSGKMRKVILGDGDLPSAASTSFTSSPSFQRIKFSSKGKTASHIVDDLVSLAPAAASGPSFQFTTFDDSPKQNRAAPAVKGPAVYGTQASFSSSSPSPKAINNTLVRANAVSPGSIYRPPPGQRQSDSAFASTTADRECGSCEHKEEKFWRYGLTATSFLCNACGLRFRKTMVHCADVENCAYIPTLPELDRMERKKTRMKWESVRCLTCRGQVIIYKREQDD